ncbi:MAG: hypothetical protein HY744_00410 [Deltaproteobacteria bacterium]|nr:hypothetical protein [Deltaproteobacteria bacterium]
MERGQDRDGSAVAPERASAGGFDLCFGTPRKLPQPARLRGKVAVLDLAFAAEGGGSRGFEKTTARFIGALGERLVAWVDHHDSLHHARFAADPRFVLATKTEHGACPEMITPELVARFARPDTILCHGDLDGLASAAKWILGGMEPYPGCDRDARAVDTCTGECSPAARSIERALRARPRDARLQELVVRHLVSGLRDRELARELDAAAAELDPLEAEAHRLAEGYRVLGPELAIVDVTGQRGRYDKTTLLLLGQRLSRAAAVADGESVTFAAPFDSGIDFLARFGLSSGMPTVVSLPRSRLAEALHALGVAPELAGVLPAGRK